MSGLGWASVFTGNHHFGLAYRASGDYPRAEASFLSIIRSLEADLARETFDLDAMRNRSRE